MVNNDVFMLMCKLSGKDPEPMGSVNILNLLKGNTTLTSLSLRMELFFASKMMCFIFLSTALLTEACQQQALNEMLKVNHTLTELDISCELHIFLFMFVCDRIICVNRFKNG